uniref:Retinoblastoma-related protein 1 n=1 Tax=Anthurium amnicola TaxID=1678845 RepID=A0A1D1Y9E8_9ARAE
MPEEEVDQSFGRDKCGKGCGLVFTMNAPISSFLLSAVEDPHLPPGLRELASDLSFQTSISYGSLRAIWLSSEPSRRPPLCLLFSGSEFVLDSPKPREKSEELKERLKKLSEMAERKTYQELIRDIMPKEEPAEPFSTYKDQLGFGLHVLLIMFTGYLVGFTAFRALFNHSTVMNTAGGILGLVCGMLLETVLFIIRTSNGGIISSSAAAKLKKNQ